MRVSKNRTEVMSNLENAFLFANDVLDSSSVSKFLAATDLTKMMVMQWGFWVTGENPSAILMGRCKSEFVTK